MVELSNGVNSGFKKACLLQVWVCFHMKFKSFKCVNWRHGWLAMKHTCVEVKNTLGVLFHKFTSLVYQLVFRSIGTISWAELFSLFTLLCTMLALDLIELLWTVPLSSVIFSFYTLFSYVAFYPHFIFLLFFVSPLSIFSFLFLLPSLHDFSIPFFFLFLFALLSFSYLASISFHIIFLSSPFLISN